MSKYAKYLSPVAFSLSCLLCYRLVALLFACVSDLIGALFAAVIYGGMILIVFLVAVPVYGVLYGIKILRHENKKLLLLIYNALVPSLCYFLLFCTEDETYRYSLLLFVWACLWSALPLLFRKKGNSNK